MIPFLTLCITLLVSTLLQPQAGAGLPALLSGGTWNPPADALTVVSGPAAPRVAFALRRTRAELTLAVEVEPFQANLPEPQIEVGVAAAKTVTGRAMKSGTRWLFRVPVDALTGKDEDWQQLRFAFAVRWPAAAGDVDVQRERFFCRDARAPHAGLPADKDGWQPFNLGEYERELTERRAQICLSFQQPIAGKATLVIEDSAGHRIRNLISGQPFSAGGQQVTWDGLDEDGRLVPPGDYVWRGAVHAGIKPDYLFSFYNHGRPPFRNGSGGSNWGADHSDPVAAATCGDRVYLGSPVAESGHNIIQLTLDGVKTAHAHIPAHVGQGRLFLVADETGFYALTEGKSWYVEPRDLEGDRWEADRPTSLLHWDLEGRELRYGGPRGEAVLATNTYSGMGSADRKTRMPAADNLAGAALLNGMIFAALRQDNQLLKVDTATGKTVGTFSVPEPGLLATDGQALYGFTGAQLARIDVATGNVTPLFTPALSGPPAGLAVATAGEVFIADNGPDQNLKVFAPDGALKRQIGVKGGRHTLGAWNGETGVYQPHGIALDRTGHLWVAETDTWPRRISAWNAADGKLWRDFFGPTFYGASGGSFDPEDPTRWVGANVLWKLDFARQSATPLSTLYRQTKPGQMEIAMPATSFNFVHRDGRTFLIGQSKYESVYELKADGTAKLWAMCGNLGAISQYPRWTLPAIITEIPEYKDALAKHTEGSGPLKDRVSFPSADAGRELGSMLWVDRNGDDIGQLDEFEILPKGSGPAIGYWGAGNSTLDLRFSGQRDGKSCLVTLKLNGFLPSGAPDYRFNEALAAAVPLETAVNLGAETIQDRFGRLLVNSSPMRAFDPDGHLLWSYPNRWIGVHGSHAAPLPETGVTQGILWFLGTAPFDSQGEVTVMNGNHGRFFVMTTDGLYLDEMFKDVRVTQQLDAYMIGGECFGGFFDRAADGTYYLQSGHTDYRIFRINGFDTVRRISGKLRVTPEQVTAAQKQMERRTTTVRQPRTATVASLPGDTKMEADPDKWPGSWEDIQWGEANRPYPFAQVRICRCGDRIHIAWRVKDPSPWRNGGDDWGQMFKTGDSVDFQFSTNPAAPVNRSAPVPGDRRLLIAPFAGKPLAVLYCHREPGTKTPTVFSSPWRQETVDRVVRLDDAAIAVRTSQSGYTITADIPVAVLGLPEAGRAVDLKGDFGVIYGDESGSLSLLRSYWSNQATGLVNDVPGEIMLAPNLWGTLRYER